MKYPAFFYIAQHNGHTFWCAESTVLQGAVGQGDTFDEAAEALKRSEEEWLFTRKEILNLPEPPIPVENWDKMNWDEISRRRYNEQ